MIGIGIGPRIGSQQHGPHGKIGLMRGNAKLGEERSGVEANKLDELGSEASGNYAATPAVRAGLKAREVKVKEEHGDAETVNREI